MHAAQHTFFDHSIYPTHPKNVPPVCDTNMIPDTEHDNGAATTKRSIGRKLAIKQRSNDAYGSQAVENRQLKALSLNR